MATDYRPDIDGLRAVAILAVVFCHARFPGFAGGYIGVDVFFVISGFLITRVLLAREGSASEVLLNFYDRRGRRLLPALMIVLVVTTLLALIVLPPTAMLSFAKSMVAAGLFSSNFWFWHVSGYFGPSAVSQPLLHTWSLGVEEQFYLLFPLAILVLDSPKWRRILPVALAVGIVISFVIAQYEVEKPATAAFYLLPTRAWELLAGSLASLKNSPFQRPATRQALSIAGIALIALPLPLYDATTPFPGASALPPVLGTALLILAGNSPQLPLVNRCLAGRTPAGIGRISYSLYLWHWPLLALLHTRVGRDLHVAESLVVVAISFGLAALTWRYIEAPARQSGFLGSRRRRFATAAAAIAAVVSVGGMIISLGGIPARVPRSVLQAEAEAVSPFFLLTEKCKPGDLNATSDWCVLRPKGPSRGTILVWGDSHAEQFYVAVASTMVPRGYTVALASLGSCPPLPGQTVVLGHPSNNSGRKCNNFNEQTLDSLRHASNLRLVVLAARWLPYIPSEERLRTRWLNAADGTPADRLESARRVYAGIADAAAAITSRGVPVLVIDQAASFSSAPPDCLIGARMAGRSDNVCDQPVQSGGSRATLRALIDRSAGAFLGVTTYHPADAICSNGRCSPVKDGHLLYRDGNHLGKAGIAYYQSLMKPVILEAMAHKPRDERTEDLTLSQFCHRPE